MPLDQAHGQDNTVVKSDGGAIGITENPSALPRWITSGQEVCQLVNDHEEKSKSQQTLKTLHHEEIPSAQKRFHKEVSNKQDALMNSATLSQKNQVPEHFHEHFILRGYRHPKSSITQCLMSLFDATNETLNIWTHFLPTWYFVWILYHLSTSNDFLGDCYTWPLLCYLLVCCAFPLASSVAHLFNVLSYRARHVCFFLDYSALALFSYGVAITYRAYSFPEFLLADNSRFTWYRDNYVNIAFFNAIMSTLVSCQTRFMEPSQFRKVLRLGSFGVPYLYDTFPIMCRLLRADIEDGPAGAQYLHTRQFLLAFLSAFLYASHLPERLSPGIFDIVGHSHQLFHIATIFAALDQLQAILLDFKERKDFVQPKWHFDLWGKSVGSLALIFWINLIVVLLYTIRLYRLKYKLKGG